MSEVCLSVDPFVSKTLTIIMLNRFSCRLPTSSSCIGLLIFIVFLHLLDMSLPFHVVSMTVFEVYFLPSGGPSLLLIGWSPPSECVGPVACERFLVERTFCCCCYRRWLLISLVLRVNAVSIRELGGSVTAWIPDELFQILEDDAVKAMYSI